MELNEQNKQMSKTEPETWKQGTNQREGRREKMGENWDNRNTATIEKKKNNVGLF